MNFKQQLYYWTHMLDEAMRNKCFLTEDREGKNINRAEKWIKDNHPEVIGQKLQNGVTITPRILTQEIRNTMPNVRMADCKFLVGITRLYFDNQANREIQSMFNKLNKMLKIICTAHADEYDNNLNDLSFEELDKKFSGAVQKELDSDREEIDKLVLLKKQDYDIIAINSFEQAQTYGKYTSWCVTQYENMFNSYTKNGLGRFYFCLKPGFQNVQQVEGEECPLDEYGKSMIAISVNDDGSLNTCTCRWNHANGGNDNMMDTKQISEFFGVNFYKTFVPYSAKELMVKYEDMTDGYDEFSAKTDTRRCMDDKGNIFYVKVIDNKIIKYKSSGVFIKDSFGKQYKLNGQEVKQSQYSGNPNDYEVGDIVLVKYDGKDIPWIVLDKKDGNLVIQSEYALEKRQFDETKSNIWKDSSLRKYLNSNEFMSKFDDEFLKHAKTTKINTGSSDGQIVTDDKFWLLSQENIGHNKNSLIKSNDSQFKFFQNHTNLNRQAIDSTPCSWWLRSAYSYSSSNVGYVYYSGTVDDSIANYYVGVLPACTIG